MLEIEAYEKRGKAKRKAFGESYEKGKDIVENTISNILE